MATETSTEPKTNENGVDNATEDGNITPEISSMRKSLSPRKPEEPSPPSSPSKDYRTQYLDLKRRYNTLSELSEKHKKKAVMDYNIMNKKLTTLETEKKTQEAEIGRLAVLNEKLKFEMNAKEAATDSQCETTDQLMKDYEALKIEHERVLKEHEDLRTVHCAPKVSRKENEEVIRLTSRAKKKENAQDELQCENASCVNETVNATIKCNACGNWICESCTNAPIAKLKPIMGKCDSIFFACDGCAGAMLHSTGKQKWSDTADVKLQDPHQADLACVDSTLLSKIDTMLDKKLLQIQTVLAGKLDPVTTICIDSDNEEVPGCSTSPSVRKSYATALKHARREEKNEEKIEQQEIEKRVNNIIIHGAEEFGTTDDEVKEEDGKYIKDVLKQLDVTEEPKDFFRIGRSNETNRGRRPLKIIMKTRENKDKAMQNLKQLKGKEDDFGKISVTEDYTKSERDEIKSYVEKAKRMSAEDPTKTYKVRGDPKNGLRMVWFKKN